MSIFAKGTAELEELKTSNSKLTSQLEQLTGTNEQLAGQLTTALSRIDALEASNGELKQSVSVFQQEVAALKTDNEKLKTHGEKKAQEIVAQLGVAPVTETKGSETAPIKTKEQLLQEMNAIQDPKAKNEFYLKHVRPLSFGSK